MRQIDQFRQHGDPDLDPDTGISTFVFDEVHDNGAYTMLVLPDVPDWPYSLLERASMIQMARMLSNNLTYRRI